MRESVILVDVGNTSTAVGISAGPAGSLRTRHFHGGLASLPAIMKEVRALARGTRPVGSVYSSVVPRCNALWMAALARITGCRPVMVSHRLNLGIRVDYPKPRSIGADRLADACGAYIRYGGPVVIADFGTALTFDVVTRDGRYVGGVIAPGLPLMLDYMADRTALLPRIGVPGRCSPIGRSTEEAMRAGAKFGYRGMVREIATAVLSRLGREKVTLCATGGFASWALDGLDLPFVIDPDLTLHGLRIIYDLNVPKGRRDRKRAL